MAATEYGINNALSNKLWAKKLAHDAIAETYFKKFMGKSSNNIVQYKTETSKAAGDKLTFGLRMTLDGDGTKGDETLEGNEEALVTHDDAIYINQLRHAVRSKGKASEQRVPFSVREECRAGLTDWMADRMDTWFFNQISGNSGQADIRYTGMQAVTAPTAGTRIVGAAGEAAETSVSASASWYFSLEVIDMAVTMAKTKTSTSPIIRPVKIGGEDRYVVFIHPYQTYQLRRATSTGQWQDIQKAALQGGKVSDNPIFTGALGMYNGCILHEAQRLPSSITIGGADTNGVRAVLCGAQAAAYATGKEGKGSSFSWEEKSFDYGNQLGVSAGLIGGLKKCIFNSTDFSTLVMTSYSPAPPY